LRGSIAESILTTAGTLESVVKSLHTILRLLTIHDVLRHLDSLINRHMPGAPNSRQIGKCETRATLTTARRIQAMSNGRESLHLNQANSLGVERPPPAAYREFTAPEVMPAGAAIIGFDDEQFSIELLMSLDGLVCEIAIKRPRDIPCKD
jgi:hypothetical protein